MPDVDIKWQYAKYVDDHIMTAFKGDKPPKYEDIDPFIKGLRIACQETIFLDFQFAVNEGVEQRLWNTIIFLKQRFKKLVDYYREKLPEKKVERRKHERRYVDFIKETRYFYTRYIQRLASHYGGIEGLARIAQCMSLDTTSVDKPVQVSPELAHLIKISCHDTLLRLGDLSRYRNDIRVATENRSWEAALGFYGLAADLCPDTGSSHNQMAVIALADHDHLSAVYHLYRALAVEEPHPHGIKNLEVEFKKITTLWEKPPASQVRLDSESTLISWFVRLHAKLYKGEIFTTYNELENEVLSRLARLLKGESSEVTLERFVIINIAAAYNATERVKERSAAKGPKLEEAIQSFFFFLRFNIRVITLLFQLLQTELKSQSTGFDLPKSIAGSKVAKAKETFSPVARRILPAVRQYCAWLVSQAAILMRSPADGEVELSMYKSQMWNILADVATIFAEIFPDNSNCVDYLLHEDMITIGFKPLRDSKVGADGNLYIGLDGKLKPRFTDPGMTRSSPDAEMQTRVRDILLCAFTLQGMEDSPIKFVHKAFVYTQNQNQDQDQNQSQPPPPPVEKISQTSSAVISSPDHFKQAVVTPIATSFQETNNYPRPFEDPDSIDTDMHRMVADLVEMSGRSHSTSAETSYGMHSRTANEVFAPAGSTGYHNFDSTPKIIPSYSAGIWNTAFTPQPNELPQSSPDRKPNMRSAFNSAQSRTANVSTNGFDEGIMNLSHKRNMSLNKQQQLMQQGQAVNKFMPMSSSAFSDPSSIYENPTPARWGPAHNGAFAAVTGDNSTIYPGNNSTIYPGASDFERYALLNSPLWNTSQEVPYSNTPPGGQGG